MKTMTLFKLSLILTPFLIACGSSPTPQKDYYEVQWKNYDLSSLGVDSVKKGDVPTYSGQTPTREPSGGYSYTFSGWSPTPAAIYKDTIFVAQYTSSPIPVGPFTVTFNSNGGTAVDSKTVEYGKKVDEPKAPTKSSGEYNNIFDGWYLDDGTFLQKFDFNNTKITSSITLYAKWIATSKIIDDFRIARNEIKSTIILKQYVGKNTTINIPSTMLINNKSYTVTSIDDYAFQGCTSLTSINIPNGVTSIGDYAFQGCTSLQSIAIPSSVTSVGGYAFSDCSKLLFNKKDNGLYLGNESNKYYALISVENADTMTSFTIDGNCKVIAAAFSVPSSLTSINIPNSVISIGHNSFSDCSKLLFNKKDNGLYLGNESNKYYALISVENADTITSFTIDGNCKVIADCAFVFCHSLSSITVDSSNPRYDSRNNCNAIIETSTNKLIVGCKNTIIPNTVTSIGYCAFANCTSLTSINIPNGVTDIGNFAFNECTSLTSVTMPNSINYIGDRAFEQCHALTSINIPSSVTYIGWNAFLRCILLTSVTIPNSITSIEANTFQYCSSLASIIIPNSINYIRDHVFQYCTSLQTVDLTTFADTTKIPTLGLDVFDGCHNNLKFYVKDTAMKVAFETKWSVYLGRFVVGTPPTI